MSISIFAFVCLYVTDIVFVYAVSDSYLAAVIAAAVLPLAIVIWQKITLFKLGAVNISKCGSTEARILQAAYDEVVSRASGCGYKLHGKPNLYISDENSRNACNCGNAIVINHPLIHTPELKAILSHEMSHYKRCDSWFSMLLGINFFLAGIAVSVITGFWILAMILMFVIIISAISRNAGLFGLVMAKILMPFRRVICNLFATVLLAIEMLISRKAEFAADEFAVNLGYGNSLIYFLSSDSGQRKPLTFTERLLSSHPSDMSRINRIQKIMERNRSITVSSGRSI